jgi:hypothetical protein
VDSVIINDQRPVDVELCSAIHPKIKYEALIIVYLLLNAWISKITRQQNAHRGCTAMHHFRSGDFRIYCIRIDDLACQTLSQEIDFALS